MNEVETRNRNPSRIETIHYGSREKPFERVHGDEMLIGAIDEHITKHIGKRTTVLDEIVSDLIHVDVHLVYPTPERNFYSVITSGMSERPMAVPANEDAPRYAELMLGLPPEWPVSMEAFKDEANYWPVRELKVIARLPHEHDTWLGFGHSVGNDEPPVPYPKTRFDRVLIATPLTTPEAFSRLELSPDKAIDFYALFPIYPEEARFRAEHGSRALLHRLHVAGVTEVLDTHRPSVC